MTPKPTPSPADRLRELHAKTTPGRWHWSTSNSWKRLQSEPRSGITTNVLEPYTVWHDRHPDCLVGDADMEFIAAAHNDLPALLSDHARLVEENGRLRAQAEADRRELDDFRTFLLGAAKQMQARAALSPSQKEGGGNG